HGRPERRAVEGEALDGAGGRTEAVRDGERVRGRTVALRAGDAGERGVRRVDDAETVHDARLGVDESAVDRRRRDLPDDERAEGVVRRRESPDVPGDRDAVVRARSAAVDVRKPDVAAGAVGVELAPDDARGVLSAREDD